MCVYNLIPNFQQKGLVVVRLTVGGNNMVGLLGLGLEVVVGLAMVWDSGWSLYWILGTQGGHFAGSSKEGKHGPNSSAESA